MGNPIKQASELYDKLTAAYEIQDKRARFETCYQLADEASYIEIHFVISMLKELESAGDTSGVPSDGVVRLLSALVSVFCGKETLRKEYLLDILEEARERKRP